MPPKKDTTSTRVDLSNNVTVNLNGDRWNGDNVIDLPVRIVPEIRATPQIREAINLCQSFFNREKTETAIALIKGSKMVQDNAIEMR